MIRKVRITMVYETTMDTDHYPDTDGSLDEMMEVEQDNDWAEFIDNATLTEYNYEDITK